MSKKNVVKEIVEKYARHENDTGSPEVQVAIMTSRIAYLTNHLKINKKDHHSRRGLFGLISKRRSLLKYLQRTDSNRYVNLISSLNIRPVQARG